MFSDDGIHQLTNRPVSRGTIAFKKYISHLEIICLEYWAQKEQQWGKYEVGIIRGISLCATNFSAEHKKFMKCAIKTRKLNWVPQFNTKMQLILVPLCLILKSDLCQLSDPVEEFSPHCLIIDCYFVEIDLTMIHLRHKTTNMQWHTRGKQTSIQN